MRRAAPVLVLAWLLGCHKHRAPPPAPVVHAELAPLPVPVWAGASLAATSAPGSGLGAAVAWDGDTLVVGAPGPVLSRTRGTLYIYSMVAGAWTLVQRLTPEGLAAEAGFGGSVAVSGPTIVVGAKASAYVIRRGPGGWALADKLSPPPGSDDFDFGDQVAVSGDTVAVAYDTGPGGGLTWAGQVYLYRQVGGHWQPELVLEAPTPHANDTFGSAIALAGDSLLVGARQTNGGADGKTEATGTAYLFERAGGRWPLSFQLDPLDAPSMATIGSEVALDGEVALVNGPERTAYVLERSAGHWHRAGELAMPPDEPSRQLAALAVHGRLAALGGWSHTPAGRPAVLPGTNEVDFTAMAAARGPGTGAVYLYQLDPGGWHPVATLANPLVQPGDDFGRALALGDGLVLVGAPRADPADTGDLIIYSPAPAAPAPGHAPSK